MRRTGDRPGSLRHRAGVRTLVAALALATGACAERAPEADWPAGALLIGHTAALQDVLDDLQRFTGTPLARTAKTWADALPDCETFEAHAPSGRLTDLTETFRCRQIPSPLDAVHRQRAAHDLLLALPGPDGSRRVATARVEPDQVAIALRWPDPPSDGPLSLLLPGTEPAGPGLLGDAERLVHVRVRPAGGLDLAALVPEGSQADRLFALRSELFAGAVLDGAWEAAVYVPEPDGTMPRAALALGFSLRRVAVMAIERFIEQLATRWSMRRTGFELGGAAGACLLDLKILPDFAPCYVATEHALVIGWNAASLVPATASGGELSPGATDAASSAVLDFAHFAAADAILAEHLAADPTADGGALPWRKLVARGTREENALQIQVALERGAAR